MEDRIKAQRKFAIECGQTIMEDKRKELLKAGALESSAFLVYAKKIDEMHEVVLAYPVPHYSSLFMSLETKEKIPVFLKEVTKMFIETQLTKEQHIIGLLTINDVFESKVNKKSNYPYAAPSEDPNRQEVIIGIFDFYDQKIVLRYPYSRVDKKIVFEKLETLTPDSLTGRIGSNFLSPDEIRQCIDKRDRVKS